MCFEARVIIKWRRHGECRWKLKGLWRARSCRSSSIWSDSCWPIVGEAALKLCGGSSWMQKQYSSKRNLKHRLWENQLFDQEEFFGSGSPQEKLKQFEVKETRNRTHFIRRRWVAETGVDLKAWLCNQAKQRRRWSPKRRYFSWKISIAVSQGAKSKQSGCEPPS